MFNIFNEITNHIGISYFNWLDTYIYIFFQIKVPE